MNEWYERRVRLLESVKVGKFNCICLVDLNQEDDMKITHYGVYVDTYTLLHEPFILFSTSPITIHYSKSFQTRNSDV